ncbi:laccase 2 [Fusarium sp. NRRL 52700]|nr:laccase 2 [Fusarium sp. NRRL 52700]
MRFGQKFKVGFYNACKTFIVYTVTFFSLPFHEHIGGDLIRVHVTNKLRYNGTAVHWDSIRQNGIMEMDGVNGVTQCPMTPDDTFTYGFRALQYGSSWYHSHCSLQCADGLAGPITIFGPSSAHYDEAKDPILITDWNHRSDIQEWVRELTDVPTRPEMNSILMNGIDHILVEIGFEDGNEPDERQGIVRYEPVSTEVSQTWRDNWTKDCPDEKYENLKPMLPWSTPPVKLDERDRDKDREIENRDGWVYLVITTPSLDRIGTNKTFKSLAHPLHLHGHDFALLAQGTNSSQVNDPNNPVTLKSDNPPRRDVSLIPAGGYLMVSFKADNPGY